MGETALAWSAQLKEQRHNKRRGNNVGAPVNVPKFSDHSNQSVTSKSQDAAKLQAQRAAHRRKNKVSKLPDNLGSNKPLNSNTKPGIRGKIDTVRRADKRAIARRKRAVSAKKAYKQNKRDMRNLFWEKIRLNLDRWFASEALGTFLGDPIPLIMLHVRVMASMPFGKKIPFLRELRYTETSFLKAMSPNATTMKPPSLTPKSAVALAIFMDIMIVTVVILITYVILLPYIQIYQLISNSWLVSLFKGTGILQIFQ